MFIYKDGSGTKGPIFTMKINGVKYTSEDGKFEFLRYNKTLPKKSKLVHVLNNEVLKLRTPYGTDNPNAYPVASSLYDPITCYVYNTALKGIIDGTFKKLLSPFDERIFIDTLNLGDSGVDKNGDYYLPKVTDDGSGVIDSFRQSVLDFRAWPNETREMTFSFTVTCKEITNNTNFLTWRPEDYATGQSGSGLSKIVSICNRGGSLCIYVKETSYPTSENTYKSKSITPEKNKKINITITYNSGLVKSYYNGEKFGEVNINIPSFGDMTVGGNIIGLMSEVFPNGAGSGVLVSYPFISHGVYAWSCLLSDNEVKQICKYEGII